jgi:tetratricopeptide (TPR) repeat protein
LSEAETAIRKSLELNPVYANAYYTLARIQLAQGKLPEALESIQKESDEFWRTMGLPLVYDKLNRKAESNAALKELIKTYAVESAYQIAEAYAYRGEKDKAFEWLERAYQQRDGGLTEMKVSLLLKSLHSDARWLPFLKKMKLDDESISKIEK